LNAKLQKIDKEMKRTKEKIAELQALLPKLDAQKTELENAEVIRVFRTADVTLADFAAFIEACRKDTAKGPAKRDAIVPRTAEQRPTDRKDGADDDE
jgi:predicted  nucleic acid-binding Zn-ribbon protein